MMSIERSGVFTCTCAEHLVPVADDGVEHRVEIGRAIALDQRARAVRRRAAWPRKNTISVGCAGLELDACAQRAAGIEPRADASRERAAGHAAPRAAASVPWRPRNSRRSPVQSVWRPPRSAKATREPNAVFQGLRANSAPVAASISVTMNGAPRRARGAQHPLDVGRDREAARGLSEIIADREPADLDRVLERHVHQQVERDAVRLVLEAAVALAVRERSNCARSSRIGAAVGLQSSPVSSSRR